MLEHNLRIVERAAAEGVAEPVVFRRCGFDRRSGLDRRSAYGLRFFAKCLVERRSTRKERRSPAEQRAGWVRVSRWASAHRVLVARHWFDVFSPNRKS